MKYAFKIDILIKFDISVDTDIKHILYSQKIKIIIKLL